MTRNNNGIMYFGGLALVILSVPFFSVNDVIAYFILFVGILFYLISRLIFFIREPKETFTSKSYLWTVIPTSINWVLLFVLGYFSYAKNESDIILLLVLAIIAIGVFAIVRKLILKERLFWY